MLVLGMVHGSGLNLRLGALQQWPMAYEGAGLYCLCRDHGHRNPSVRRNSRTLKPQTLNHKPRVPQTCCARNLFSGTVNIDELGIFGEFAEGRQEQRALSAGHLQCQRPGLETKCEADDLETSFLVFTLRPQVYRQYPLWGLKSIV